MPLWKAGQVVPTGTYVRVDSRSYRAVTLEWEGPLPAMLDGHVAGSGPIVNRLSLFLIKR